MVSRVTSDMSAFSEHTERSQLTQEAEEEMERNVNYTLAHLAKSDGVRSHRLME